MCTVFIWKVEDQIEIICTVVRRTTVRRGCRLSASGSPLRPPRNFSLTSLEDCVEGFKKGSPYTCNGGWGAIGAPICDGKTSGTADDINSTLVLGESSTLVTNLDFFIHFPFIRLLLFFFYLMSCADVHGTLYIFSKGKNVYVL